MISFELERGKQRARYTAPNVRLMWGKEDGKVAIEDGKVPLNTVEQMLILYGRKITACYRRKQHVLYVA
jgi:hypothetical protein